MHFLRKRGVSLGDELLGEVIHLTEGCTQCQVRHQVLLSIECEHICRLLLIGWIDEQGPAGHGLHVGVLCANIDVDGIRIQLVIVAVHALELVEIEMLT